MRERFSRDGYVIMREVVPSASLESLRNTVDVLVARHRESDPSWDTTATARADISRHVDGATVEAVVFALDDNTLGVSTRLLDCPSEAVAVSSISVLCNPEFEPDVTPPSGQSWGTDPRNWHRDVRPDHDGPLNTILANHEANGIGYVQWNIALHDDGILHVIPGSHRRLTSEEEAQRLNSEGGTQSPLSGATCVDLKAGDGVVYNNVLLHQGSKYTSRQKRRTIHLGYRSFGRIFPHQRDCALSERICRVLPPDTPSRHLLERSFELFRNELAICEQVFCAVVTDDVPQFHAALARLQPASEGRLSCVILLSRLARNLYNLSQECPADEVRKNSGTQAASVEMQKLLATRFTTDEMEKLWGRFRVVDTMLRSGEPKHVSGFLGPPTNYLFEHAPPDMTADRVVAAIFERTTH